jgi:hypothetical protein
MAHRVDPPVNITVNAEPKQLVESVSKRAEHDLEHIPLTFTCSLRERKSWCIPAR